VQTADHAGFSSAERQELSLQRNSNVEFQREINIYSDAKLLQRHSIGGTPINKKNVLCDWTKTRGRRGLGRRTRFWHTHAQKGLPLITWLTYTAAAI